MLLPIRHDTIKTIPRLTMWLRRTSRYWQFHTLLTSIFVGCQERNNFCQVHLVPNIS